MFKKLKFWLVSNRIGPDMPLTHFLLHSQRFGRMLCSKKFNSFGEGSSFRVGSYAIGTNSIDIGKFVTIRPGSMLFANPNEKMVQIKIGDYALIGSGVHVYVSNHAFDDVNQPIYFQGHDNIMPVEIADGCWIGANVTILPGVRVGKNAVVAAGSVVTKSVEDFTLVAGVPAKFIKRIG